MVKTCFAPLNGFFITKRRRVDREQLPRDLTREELYEKVWQTPMWRLCNEFGLTGRGLGKLCERWNIPVPPRGYWRRLETGGKTTRILLPPDSRPMTIRITPSPQRPPPQTLAVIHVPDRFSSPHQLVRRTRKNWLANKLFEPTSLDLRVSKGARGRALRIADAIIRELERRGNSVVVDGHRKTFAVVGGEKVGFYIEERFTRHETELTEDEKERHVYKPRFEFEPSGRLSLRIDGYSRDIQHGWSDGVRQKVETVLPEFLDSLERYAERERIRRQELLEEEKRWAEVQRLRWAEERRVKELDEQLALWRTARDLKGNLLFVGSIDPAMLNADWMEWVRGRLAAYEAARWKRIIRPSAATPIE